MDDFLNGEEPITLAIFESPEQVAKVTADRLQNDQGAMSTHELTAAIMCLALNVDHYTKECTKLRLQVENLLAGRELAQTMTDKIEEGRNEYLIRSRKRKPTIVPSE